MSAKGKKFFKAGVANALCVKNLNGQD